MIWEMRDFRYLFTVREIYIDDFYGLRNSRRKLNVIIDAGAHVGFFTMYGLNFIDVKGKIIALEPSPGNFLRLIRHLNLNSTKIKGSVLPLPYALSDKDGEVFLEITEDTETSHITKFPKKAVKCKSITLASLIKSFGLSQVDILKLDVEGAEHFILREERTRTILRNGLVSEIRAELHGHLNDRLDLINFLRSLGYIINVEEHENACTKIYARYDY
jgi:FkbM family methyltransferase